MFNRLLENGQFDFTSFETYMVGDVVPVVKDLLNRVPVYGVTDPFIALRGLAAAYTEGRPL